MKNVARSAPANGILDIASWTFSKINVDHISPGVSMLVQQEVRREVMSKQQGEDLITAMSIQCEQSEDV